MYMSTVTIPQKEYKKLRKQAAAYHKLAGTLFKSVVKDPVEDVVDDFRKTGLYTEAFLHDLGEGLRRSSYISR